MSLLGRRAPKTDALPAVMKTYLLRGEEPARDAEGYEDFVTTMYFNLGQTPTFADLWKRHRAGLLAEWIREHPGSRPFAWWEFDSAGSRRKVGGSGVLYPHGECLKGHSLPADGHWDVDPDPADPPRFESEATCLKRLRALEPGEEKRIARGAWKPEVLEVDWDVEPGWTFVDPRAAEIG